MHNGLRQNFITNSLRNWLFDGPVPTRFRVLRALDKRFGFLKDYRRKLDFGIIDRPY